MAEVVIVPNREAGGALVADAIIALIRANPQTVLGLATGSTPLPVYAALAERSKGVDVSQVQGFALDEYVGLPSAHPESYRSVITREVVEPLGLNPELVHVPRGSGESPQTAGAEYEAAIEAAGRLDHARFFASIDDVPRHCVTQGLGTILRAKHIVLLAFGAGKARAVAAAVEGPLTASVPGSVVQLHEHATIIVDEEAAAELANSEYYRYTYENKPAWQGL